VYVLIGPAQSIGPFTIGAQIHLDQVGDALAHAQILPIVAIAASVLVSLVPRAARWQIYFLPKWRVPLRPLLSTLSISYMASALLPFRAGELVRAIFLGQRERIPVSGIVGTILVEKLFDFLAIGILLALLILMIPVPAAAQVAGVSITSVILVGFAFVIALAVWREPTLGIIAAIERHLPFGLGARIRLRDAAGHFAEGTDSLRDARLWLRILGWTAITWTLAVTSTLGGMLALNVPAYLPAALFVVVLTSTGQAVPSSPGYVGVYHAAATFALTSFGVDPATAVGVALITHAFSYGSLVVVGLAALWTGGYTFNDVLKGSRSRAGVGVAPVSAEL
jgi:glycosyltransferase 2 family protein